MIKSGATKSFSEYSKNEGKLEFTASSKSVNLFVKRSDNDDYYQNKK